ncbi:MAG: hypothetical protein WKF62_09035 [Solirubrobacterales bacterium]
MAALLIAGCGSKPRQDENEVEGDYPIEVTVAEFPARQRLAETTDLELGFRNIGDEDIENLAVTIYTGDEKADGSFNLRSEQQGLADPNRPVWILENDYPKLLELGTSSDDLDAAPTAGAESASTNTYTFGELPVDETIHTVFRVTPVQGGTYTVHYEVAAGLDGKARAVTKSGEPVEGEFVATISTRPPAARVTESGNVVKGD